MTFGRRLSLINAAVIRLVKDISDEEVNARFLRLRAQEIRQKVGGELVTVADLCAEERLTSELTQIIPGSSVVGEEGVSAGSASLAALGDAGPVWVIDPVDGTANFAAGNADFATLVALCVGNQIQASWTYAPAHGLLATARAGMGAEVNGRPVVLSSTRPWEEWRVVVTAPDFVTAPERESQRRLSRAGFTTMPCTCAGLAYVGLATSRYDAAVFGWQKPWDHCAGLLLHAEAGGRNSTIDGSEFRPAGGNAMPLVAAPDERSLNRLRALLG